MPPQLASLFNTTLATLQRGALDAFELALAFAVIAFFALGPRAFVTKARTATGEITTNVTLNIFDLIVITPLLGLALGVMGAWMQTNGVALVQPAFWHQLPAPLVGLIAIFAGDFIGYWRHRLEHTPPLWPAHAIHHSDTRMTWTTIFRFHPINRFSTGIIDTGVLALCGFPPEALFLNNIVRHYWGSFIHMDLPWTFGILGRVICSPVMHRWHHIRDADGAGVNFATVFSVFDQAFGTYSVPGPCTMPLGVRDDIGPSAASQLWHPFKVGGRYLLSHSGARAARTRNPGANDALCEPLGSGSHSVRPE
ncbi:MAG: sterol desaturase family protein [Terricaulis sp.]